MRASTSWSSLVNKRELVEFSQHAGAVDPLVNKRELVSTSQHAGSWSTSQQASWSIQHDVLLS